MDTITGGTRTHTHLFRESERFQPDVNRFHSRKRSNFSFLESLVIEMTGRDANDNESNLTWWTFAGTHLRRAQLTLPGREFWCGAVDCRYSVSLAHLISRIISHFLMISRYRHVNASSHCPHTLFYFYFYNKKKVTWRREIGVCGRWKSWLVFCA